MQLNYHTWVGKHALADTDIVFFLPLVSNRGARTQLVTCNLSLWLIGTVRAEPETVISWAWVQSPDPAE